jgi:hypothetical protein
MKSLIRKNSLKRRNQRKSKQQIRQQLQTLNKLYGGTPENNNTPIPENNNTPIPANPIEREIPIVNGNNTVLVKLYKINIPVLMLDHVVKNYQFVPKNGVATSTYANTIFVSSLPGFQGYEFKISKQSFPHGRETEYIVTRIK